MLLLGFRADSRGSEARARQRQQLRQSAPWVEMQARHLKRPNGWPGSLTLDAAYASRHTLEVGGQGDCFQMLSVEGAQAANARAAGGETGM